MKGNEILVSANPRGVFLEGIIYGTPKPGTCMQIKAGVAPVGGRLTYEAYNPGTDGNQRLVMVLLPNALTGGMATTAYKSGDRGFLYCPLPGEELNVLIASPGTGTGDAIAVGDILIINDGDGLAIKTTGSPESEPFQAMEDVSDVVATGTLVHVICTGQ